MTDEDVQLLAELAMALNLNFAQVVSSIAFYGAYFVLCGLALYTLINRRQKILLTRVLFAALLLTFLVVTADVATMTAYTFNQLRFNLLQNIDLPLSERIKVFKSLRWSQAAKGLNLFFGGGADCGLVFLINDALVAWRALAFCPAGTSSARAVRSAFYTLLFSSFATWVAFVVMYFQGPSTSYHNSQIEGILEVTSYTLGIIVNLASTAIIGYVTYRHTSQHPGALRIPSFQILVLLTELGLFYGIIQVIRLALALGCVPGTPLDSSLAMVANVWQICGLVVTATYTPAIILIVNYGYSLKETIIYNHHQRNTTEPKVFPLKERCPLEERDTSSQVFSNIAFSPNSSPCPNYSTLSQGSSITPTEGRNLC